MTNFRENETLAVISNDMSYVKRDIAEIKNTVSTGYVTRSEYEPVKKIVYGMVSLILIAVVGGMISLVVR